MSKIPSEIAVQELSPGSFAYLDQLLCTNIEAGVFPAVSLVVHRAGAAIFQGAWGWLDPETRQHPVAIETRFDLASLTKLFTTTAFLRQIDAGRVNLEDSLTVVLPEFAEKRHRPIEGQQDPHTLAAIPADERYLGQHVDASVVHFRHLLTHTAGLPAWRAIFAGEEILDPAVDEHKRRWQQLLPKVYHYPFNAPPGNGVNYSDNGMILLGAALVRMLGNTLPTIIDEWVLRPIKVQSICFQPLARGLGQMAAAPTEYDVRWRKRRVWGEVHDENAASLGGVAGHAGLFGTAADVARFGEAWRINEYGLNDAIYRAAIQHQSGPIEERRGLGWLLKAAHDCSSGDHFSADSFGHTGFTGTSLWIDPKRQLVVALLTNRVYRGRHEPGIHECRRRVHDILAGEQRS